MKQRIARLSIKMMKTMGVKRFLLKTPSRFISVADWITSQKDTAGVKYISLIPAEEIMELPPVVVGHEVSGRFSRHFRRKSKEAFVAVIPGGRVLGAYANIILTSDNQVLADVSREFGAEGGRKPADFSIFHDRLTMPPVTILKGKTAVVSTSGSNNFHHWNYDVLPRLYLLRKAGVLDQMDHLIINHRSLPFQVLGLQQLGIDLHKIINSYDQPAFFLEAESLYIPSLPEDLGTISPWVIGFLRGTFLPQPPTRENKPQKLYISRRNAPSRRIINEAAFMEEILGRGYTEFIPEDYSMTETAACFAAAKSIVSIHGSGLSNLCFVSEGTKVLDIMAPYHQDPYYWMICNQRKATYVALFSEGGHPADDVDLVKLKVDHDLLIDINKLKKALDLVSPNI